MKLFHIGYRQRNGYCEQDRNIIVALFAENAQDALQKADYWLYYKSNIQNPESFESEWPEEVEWDKDSGIVYIDEY